MEINDGKSKLMAVVPHKTQTSLSDFLNITPNGGGTNGAVSGTREGGEDSKVDNEETDTGKDEEGGEAAGKEPGKGEPKTEQTVIQSLEAKVKHGGKEYTVKELINAYETRETLGKRFSEVGSKEKYVADREKAIREKEQELAVIDEKWQEIGELVKEGKTFQALQILHSMSPNPEEVDFEAVMGKSMEMVNELNEMDDEQRKAYWQKQQLETRERAVKKNEAKLKAKDERAQLEAYYLGLLNEHGLTDEELDQQLQTLYKNADFKKKYDEYTPTQKIDYCVSYALGQKYLGRVNEAMSKVDADLVNNHELKVALIDNCDPRYTVEEIVEVLQSYLQAANGKSTAPKKDTDANNDTVTTSEKAPEEAPGSAEKTDKPVKDWANLFARS